MRRRPGPRVRGPRKVGPVRGIGMFARIGRERSFASPLQTSRPRSGSMRSTSCGAFPSNAGCCMSIVSDCAPPALIGAIFRRFSADYGDWHDSPTSRTQATTSMYFLRSAFRPDPSPAGRLLRRGCFCFVCAAPCISCTCQTPSYGPSCPALNRFLPAWMLARSSITASMPTMQIRMSIRP